MNKAFFFVLLHIGLLFSFHLTEKSKISNKKIACEKRFILIPRLPGLPDGLSLDVNDTQYDNGIATYSKVNVGTSYHTWCKIGNKFRSNINNLYLNVMGYGYFCHINGGCIWNTEVDAFYESNSGYREWDIITIVPNLIYSLRNLNGSLSTFEGKKEVNLANTNSSDPRQQWIIHYI